MSEEVSLVLRPFKIKLKKVKNSFGCFEYRRKRLMPPRQRPGRVNIIRVCKSTT